MAQSNQFWKRKQFLNISIMKSDYKTLYRNGTLYSQSWHEILKLNSLYLYEYLSSNMEPSSLDTDLAVR